MACFVFNLIKHLSTHTHSVDKKSFLTRASVELALLEITFFLSPDFHELWHGRNNCRFFAEVVAWPQWLRFTEVKW